MTCLVLVDINVTIQCVLHEYSAAVTQLFLTPELQSRLSDYSQLLRNDEVIMLRESDERVSNNNTSSENVNQFLKYDIHEAFMFVSKLQQKNKTLLMMMMLIAE